MHCQIFAYHISLASGHTREAASLKETSASTENRIKKLKVMVLHQALPFRAAFHNDRRTGTLQVAEHSALRISDRACHAGTKGINCSIVVFASSGVSDILECLGRSFCFESFVRPRKKAAELSVVASRRIWSVLTFCFVLLLPCFSFLDQMMPMGPFHLSFAWLFV